MNTQIRSQFDKELWQRILFVLLFFVIAYVVRFVILIISLIQFVFLFTLKAPNKNLSSLGTMISLYFYEVMQYLNFSTEKPPFPFSPWPKSPNYT